jgi:predicted nucleic acid-binding protein
VSELADTSVWMKRRLLPLDVQAAFESALDGDDVATCDAVKAELLHTARNVGEFRAMRGDLDALPFCPIGGSQWARAFDVYELLAARGGSHHREVPFNDLLVAAAAEAAGIPVLHYDRHFERIAEVTGQPVRAIAPLGSL